MNKFNTNQIVKGKAAGHFIVLGYRTLNEKTFVQVKPYCNKTKKALPGEMAFDESALVEVDPALELLVAIGVDASNGKICQHCGRGFKKSTGTPRSCSKCLKEGA